MSRRVGEQIEVRVAGEPGDAPMSFLWRGRLYVVREVLGHWRERREWWATAARALHGDDLAPAGSGPAALEQEQDVWRVAASAGRSFGSGVYDLRREPTSDPTSRSWQLVRITD